MSYTTATTSTNTVFSFYCIGACNECNAQVWHVVGKDNHYVFTSFHTFCTKGCEILYKMNQLKKEAGDVD